MESSQRSRFQRLTILTSHQKFEVVGRSSTFATCRSGNRTFQNYKGRKSENRAPSLSLEIGNGQTRIENTDDEK